ncbi:MAG: hypothetical protein AAGF12_07550 [Myxococcota bacterium]
MVELVCVAVSIGLFFAIFVGAVRDARGAWGRIRRRARAGAGPYRHGEVTEHRPAAVPSEVSIAALLNVLFGLAMCFFLTPATVVTGIRLLTHEWFLLGGLFLAMACVGLFVGAMHITGGFRILERRPIPARSFWRVAVCHGVAIVLWPIVGLALNQSAYGWVCWGTQLVGALCLLDLFRKSRLRHEDLGRV